MYSGGKWDKLLKNFAKLVTERNHLSIKNISEKSDIFLLEKKKLIFLSNVTKIASAFIGEYSGSIYQYIKKKVKTKIL